LDLARHTNLYFGIFSIIKSLCENLTLVSLLGEDQSIYDLCKILKCNAEIFISRLKEEEEFPEIRLAREILSCWSLLEAAVRQYKDSMECVDEENETPTFTCKTLAELQLFYRKALQQFQFDLISMVNPSTGLHEHHYANQMKDVAVIPREKILRLAGEQTSLMNSLPLDWSSSIFARVDESRMDLMKVIITGPSDTPYESGAFQFDIYFPQEYPGCPPNLNLHTTGNGSVRFNPNLYNCGKVCLSLLGTWSGAEGENWNKETSTLLQVLVSVQSLIFVSEPYFNEPGYERQIGTKLGEEASRKYNETIRLGTAEHAILGQLRNPSKGFEDVLRAHFYLKKEEVFRTVEKWVQSAKQNSSSLLSRMEKVFQDIQENCKNCSALKSKIYHSQNFRSLRSKLYLFFC